MLVFEIRIDEFGKDKTIFWIKNDTMTSLSYDNARQSDFERPSYGIISKTGSVSFVDKNSVVKNNLQWLTNNKKFNLYIFLVDTIKNTSVQIADYITNKWAYNANTAVVDIDFADALSDWQDRNVSALSCDITSVKATTYATIYNYLRDTLKSYGDNGYYYLYNLDSIDDLDEKTQAVLNDTFVMYPIIESGSLWQNFEKLCQALGLHIYYENGRTHCVYGL